MSGVKRAASAAVDCCRVPSRRAAGMLAALLVLFAIGALQPAHADRGLRAGSAVVLDDVTAGSAALAIRSVRQLPAHPPSPQLQPALTALTVPSGVALLFAICTPIWMQSRRSRQAYLLSSAGPGPPSFS